MLNVRSAFRESALFAECTSRLGKARNARSFVLAAALLCSITPAKAEYRLHVGDVIEISVARLPELKQRVPVQLDGTISFPLLGTLPVANLSPAEAQAKVQAMLAAKVFRQRAPDGHENSVTIEPDEVTATVVEYRPIYVNGDVSKPGEQAYRPLMTVRQAITLSGGYDVIRLRMNNPILEAADLQAEYESLWTEFAREQAHVWRLQQELGQQATVERKALLDVPVARSMALAIVNVEADQLKTRQEDAEAERTFFKRGIVQADEQIQVLSEQLKTEEQGTQADAEELERAKELFNRGTLTMLRVSDARRAALLSSTRKLQTTAQLMQTRRQRDDFSRQIERLDGQRRSDILKELQEATLALSRIRFKLQSTGEKLQYTAFAKSQLARGFGSKPAITIVRNGASGSENLVANEDFELQPGDVVEIALRVAPVADPGSQ
ncbi:MAG: exopolysaccharide biosynthesis protein [Bradyrhizobium sp.]|jgi:polysaccharide export outer membrane protein|uniref:polysaccharide biosynthesis/export family protein n=1 Tax=Bradyrhizobium sp. TaxID=376 RepID=UPI001202FF00|nr:polysaccharide biosynthesis/export family protein [Bradyrhizobium sp.]THD56710.1 MAG: exopolysaccharide biosynthesis protein [Bradyrhizobium sp.]